MCCDVTQGTLTSWPRGAGRQARQGLFQPSTVAVTENGGSDEADGFSYKVISCDFLAGEEAG